MSLQFLYGTEMNHAEAVAKCVIEGVLPVTMEYQSDQAHGECDFELRYRSGATAAVEVTASADQEQLQTIAAIRDEKKGGSSLRATKCEKSWLIFPAKGARIDKIRAAADERLSRLEKEGMTNSRACVTGIKSAFRMFVVTSTSLAARSFPHWLPR